MATKARMTVGTGKAIATSSEMQSNAEVHFQRVIIEGTAARADRALAGEVLRKYLRSAGGSIEMNVDASTVNAPYTYQCPAGMVARVDDLDITIADDGIDSLWTQFGGLSALTAGITAVVDDGATVPTTLIDLTDGSPWKRSSELMAFAEDRMLKDSTAGVDTIFCRVACGLYLTAGQRIVVTLRDNLSALSALRMAAVGVLRSADAV